AVRELQTEDQIGDKADFVGDALVRNLYPKRKGVALAEALVGERSDDFVRVNKPYVAASRSRALQRHVEIHDLKLVLDERSPGVAILAAPFDIGEIDAVALDQEPRAAIGKGVSHGRRSRSRIVVEFGARAIDVAGMEQPAQAIIGAIGRAAD